MGAGLKRAVAAAKATRKKTPPQRLRVWHIPQIPGAPFHVDVESVDAARLVLRSLADYDAFQFNHNIKPDYANAQGLEVFEDGEWCEWSDDEGRDIDGH